MTLNTKFIPTTLSAVALLAALALPLAAQETATDEALETTDFIFDACQAEFNPSIRVISDTLLNVIHDVYRTQCVLDVTLDTGYYVLVAGPSLNESYEINFGC